VQPPVPAHAPLHPANAEPAAGVATRDTLAPALKPWRQSLGHAIPSGALVTCPLPPPRVTTSRRIVAGGAGPLRVKRCRRSLPVSATTSVVPAASVAAPVGAVKLPTAVPALPMTSQAPVATSTRSTRLVPVSATYSAVP
jgi:hypothetical protein